MFIGSFVNGNVNTFRGRILSFWFVHVHEHLCVWQPLSVNICWVTVKAVNSLCWWTVCSKKKKQRLVIGKSRLNNVTSLWNLLPLPLLCVDPSIAFHYILCVGGVWAHCVHSLHTAEVWMCTGKPDWVMDLLPGSWQHRDMLRSTCIQLLIQTWNLTWPSWKPIAWFLMAREYC